MARLTLTGIAALSFATETSTDRQADGTVNLTLTDFIRGMETIAVGCIDAHCQGIQPSRLPDKERAAVDRLCFLADAFCDLGTAVAEPDIAALRMIRLIRAAGQAR